MSALIICSHVKDGVELAMQYKLPGVIQDAIMQHHGTSTVSFFYEKALDAHPEIPVEMEQGQFGTLRGWLTENIYRSGGKYTALELCERVTGKPDLDVQPLMRYFRTKYGEIYGIRQSV